MAMSEYELNAVRGLTSAIEENTKARKENRITLVEASKNVCASINNATDKLCEVMRERE